MTNLPNFNAGSEPTAGQMQALLPLFGRVSTNQPLTASSTVLQNVTGLVVNPSINVTYKVTMVLIASNAAGTAEDVQYGFTFPAGATLVLAGFGGTTAGVSGGTTTDMNILAAAVTSGVGTFGYGCSTTATGALLIGTLVMGSTAGSLQVKAAQFTSGVNVTSIVAGSSIFLEQQT